MDRSARLLARMRHARATAGAAALALAIAACASSPARVGSQNSVLTAQEIEAAHATDAYDAIRKLRGGFLATRGPVSISNTTSPLPTVYVDGTRFGDTSTLQSIPASQIAMIRFYQAYEAQTRFGHDNMGGAIDIITKR